jgi:hypothetical protein
MHRVRFRPLGFRFLVYQPKPSKLTYPCISLRPKLLQLGSAPMLFQMPQPNSTCLVHFIFEPLQFLIVCSGHDQSLERIHEPAVPKCGVAVFRVQFFPVRAVHHERRIAENRGMHKGNL